MWDFFLENQIVSSVLPTGPTEFTEHSCANNKFFVAKSNKFDYSNEKTCVFQIFFVTLCAEIEMDNER